jgi:signal transduction histidine kinase/ligand-binding sensor domain-containing protein
LPRLLGAYVTLVSSLTRFACSAAAQHGAVSLRHLNHTAWTQADFPALRGAFRIARSNDGYLWINARDGVLRFDGSHFVLLDSNASPLLKVRRHGSISPLLVDRTGTLWLERPDRSLLTYRDGVFCLGATADSAAVTQLALDGAGRVYAYTPAAGSNLFEVRDNKLVRVALPAALTKFGLSRVVADTGRGMWIGGLGGLWHVVDDRAEHVAIHGGQPNHDVTPLVQTADGTLWATGLGAGPGLERIVDGHAHDVRMADSSDIVDAYEAVADSAGAVWFSTRGHGVLRWANGRLESFTQRDGLSDVLVYGISVDANGVAMMATGSGLDRLRPTAFIAMGAADGIEIDSPQRLVRGEAGAFWTTGIDGHAVTTFRPAKTRLGGDTIVARRITLPSTDSYTVLGPARGGGVWIGTRAGGLFRYQNAHIDRRAQLPKFEGRALQFAIEQPDGDVWVGRDHLGLDLLHHEHFVQSPVAWTSGAVQDSRGHVWIADAELPLLHETVNGRIVRTIGRAEGLPGFVSSLVIERDDLLWAMSDSGIVRIANGRVSLTHSPPIEFVQRYGPELMIADGWLWFASDDRIGRFSLASLRAAADGEKVQLASRDVTPGDGVLSPRRSVFQIQTIQRGADDRLWFATPGGLVVFDSSRERVPTTLAVRAEEITAHGRVSFAGAQSVIAPNPDRVTIHFAIPDLAFPERDRAQYRLDGVDREWVDAGATRLATYTQLRPGAYAFHVRAWNGETTAAPLHEATLDFRVEARWYQLFWLRSASVPLGVAVIVVAVAYSQRRRSRVATARLAAQFEVRLAERTRIARELHDTLLQGFTGLVLQLEGLRRTIGRSTPDAATDELSRILLLADGTLFDARQSVWDKRTPDVDQGGLAAALESACQSLTTANDIVLSFTVTGAERPLARQLEATVLHVSREALRNIVEHARASTVRVELFYTRDELGVRVADDGVGMSSHQLEAASSKGHFGILGMRERAAALGGWLEVETRPGEGTCVVLTLPASLPATSDRQLTN